jgi:hypothetical protein
MVIDSNKIYKIVFKKKDGSERILIGTRNEGKIPKEHHPKGIGTVNPAVVTIFDLENAGWRSFKPETLISVEELTEYA